jgi:hypothetical protein
MINPIHHHLNQNLIVASLALDNLVDSSYNPTKVVKYKQVDLKDFLNSYFLQFTNK